MHPWEREVSCQHLQERFQRLKKMQQNSKESLTESSNRYGVDLKNAGFTHVCCVGVIALVCVCVCVCLYVCVCEPNWRCRCRLVAAFCLQSNTHTNLHSADLWCQSCEPRVDTFSIVEHLQVTLQLTLFTVLSRKVNPQNKL